MSRRSLRPQLNQIRIWVHQGRTDAWIAHQLEVSASELKEFRRQHDLSADNADESAVDHDLRDEIEAEIEAATAADEARRKAEAEKEARQKAEEEKTGTTAAAEDESDDGRSDETDGDEAEGRPRRRRRRSSRNQLEGTFDHGEEGFGLWLDPAIQDIQNYTEHWADQREVTVTVESDQIVIRRTGDNG